MELGGFAEDPKVIDGDFNAFNYCTAENYADAFYAYFNGIPKDGKLLNLGLKNIEIKEYELR